MLDGGQRLTARAVVWLLHRGAAAAGAPVVFEPGKAAREAGLSERDFRDALAGLVARGYVALAKRGGVFEAQATQAGARPLGAYAVEFAALHLTEGGA